MIWSLSIPIKSTDVKWQMHGTYLFSLKRNFYHKNVLFGKTWTIYTNTRFHIHVVMISVFTLQINMTQ